MKHINEKLNGRKRYSKKRGVFAVLGVLLSKANSRSCDFSRSGLRLESVHQEPPCAMCKKYAVFFTFRVSEYPWMRVNIRSALTSLRRKEWDHYSVE